MMETEETLERKSQQSTLQHASLLENFSPYKLDGPDGVHQPLKEKIQATKSKIPVCCLQQMGQLGLFSLTLFFLLSF